MTSLAELARAGLVDPADVAAVFDRYAVALTPSLMAQIGGPDTPLARQFVPDARELHTAPHEVPDPIGDTKRQVVPGLIHRYPDRVLLMPVTHCPVYCRFCFRREQVGQKGSGHLDSAALDKALAYIADHEEIWEVILSGGDPLILSPRRLGALLQRLAAIGHVKTLRIHSRVPLVDSDRITAALVAALKTAIPVHLVLHANHASEFSESGRAAIARLVDAGIPMLSQSVLLAGVNDRIEDLEGLMRTFVENRVKPYYLHQLDPAPGTAHFHVPREKGLALVAELRRRASGLCQPLYVTDSPDATGKTPITGR